uniref:CCHC-type domain-containing protein n=1 Tax=Globodera pallida TaxID=36090 RepID=A0A183C3U2_GLOPA
MASTQQELSKLTVFELRKQLKKRKLPVAGVKAALIKRLIEEEEESAPATKKHLPTMAAPQAKPGHISRECPQAGGGGEGGNIDNGCSNSNEPVHISRECPQAGGGGGATLIKKLVGTLDQNEINNDSDTDSVCSNCNDLGHFSRECPYAGGGGGHGGSGLQCLLQLQRAGLLFSRMSSGVWCGGRRHSNGYKRKRKSQPCSGETTISFNIATNNNNNCCCCCCTTTNNNYSGGGCCYCSNIIIIINNCQQQESPQEATQQPQQKKDFRGHDSWIRSSWSDSLEITAEFLEDSTMDTVLAALTGQAVAQHLLLKLEKRPLYRQLIVKLGTGPVLSTDIAFCAEATDKQRTEAGGGGGATLIKKLVGTLDQNEINNDSDTDSVCSNCNDLGHFSRVWCGGRRHSNGYKRKRKSQPCSGETTISFNIATNNNNNCCCCCCTTTNNNYSGGGCCYCSNIIIIINNYQQQESPQEATQQPQQKKDFRGHDSWIRSSWSDSLEITAEFLEDSTMDTVLAALTGQAVAQHLLLKLEKRPLYRQLIVKLGTGPVLSTDIAFCAEATDKQRTEAAASLMDFIKKEF